jgi:cell division protein FtsZ
MGTGEGEGPNRALEAAERAIANPLLDGVSMQGAKGVIISIIGGDDMKLLEVDEAANHIRELVDPNANIIWGSAFNPNLDGKIRVSVVATGIEQSVEQAEVASRPLSMGTARGPAFPNATPRAAAPEPVAAPVAQVPAPAPEPMEPEAWTPAEQGGVPPVGDTAGQGLIAEKGFAAPSPVEPEPFDLTLELGDEQAPSAAAADDELSLDPAQQAPVPPRFGKAVPGDRPTPKVSTGGGSTLFERMANLSRGTGRGEDDDGDDEGGALNIPRFLGRQNNQ